MRAAVFEEFQKPLSIRDVSDPSPPDHRAVIKVKATADRASASDRARRSSAGGAPTPGLGRQQEAPGDPLG